MAFKTLVRHTLPEVSPVLFKQCGSRTHRSAVCLDPGSVRVGMAICRGGTNVPLAAGAISRKHRNGPFPDTSPSFPFKDGTPQDLMVHLLSNRGVLFFGMPISLKGTRTPTTDMAVDTLIYLDRMLAGTNNIRRRVPFVLVDERLSSQAIKAQMKIHGMSAKQMAGKMDQGAATWVLGHALAACKALAREA